MSSSSTYVSTRGNAPEIGFADALLSGPAIDGGLYVPKAWPRLDPETTRSAGRRPYPELAGEILKFFIGDAVSDSDLRSVVSDAYATFDTPEIVPLREIGADLWLLELFHGPTLAFKDIALQVVGRLMDRELKRRDKRAVIVGATSGDTGAAAIAALAGLPSVDVFILHPKGRISDVQRRLMTTVAAPNVHNIALEGTFDTAQTLVKSLFADEAFRQERDLSAFNSINWGRVAAQIGYYVKAASLLGAPDKRVSFTVPTGNFGDIFAGYCASQMGVPIDRLVIATNENDILVRSLTTGRYQPAGVVATTSPSMDIQVSSNFERLLFEANKRDGTVVRDLMKDLQSKGYFVMSEPARAFMTDRFDAVRASESDVASKMRDIHRETGVIVDPHTAVALVSACKGKRLEGPMIVLSTAHPAKFPDAVERVTGVRPQLPDHLKSILSASERVDVLPPDISRLKTYIRERTKV
jgi:threonine synthase